MKKALVLLALLTLTFATAHAQASPYGPQSPTPIRSFLDGFALTAGFDWEHPSHADLGLPDNGSPPFFIGGELRLPLCSWADLGGNLDREFVKESAWKGRAYIAARLWRRN